MTTKDFYVNQFSNGNFSKWQKFCKYYLETKLFLFGFWMVIKFQIIHQYHSFGVSEIGTYLVVEPPLYSYCYIRIPIIFSYSVHANFPGCPHPRLPDPEWNEESSRSSKPCLDPECRTEWQPGTATCPTFLTRRCTWLHARKNCRAPPGADSIKFPTLVILKNG